MRGADGYNESLFSTVRLDDFVPANHPLRPIRQRINDACRRWIRGSRRCTRPTSRAGA